MLPTWRRCFAPARRPPWGGPWCGTRSSPRQSRPNLSSGEWTAGFRVAYLSASSIALQLVVELGVLQSQPTVGRKHFKGLLVSWSEAAVLFLVDQLRHGQNLFLGVENGHAEDVAGVKASFLQQGALSLPQAAASSEAFRTSSTERLKRSSA